jgi:AraC-like DNA-binding protein
MYHFSHHISILLSGFSFFACLILLSAYLLFLPNMRKSPLSKVACALLLGALSVLQLAHYGYFSEQLALLTFRSYGVLLTLIPPSFYLFSREILSSNVQYRPFDLVHAIPIILALVLPISALPAFAFMFGTAYTFWFTRVILQLRNKSGRFKFELFFFGMFAIMALGALMLGLALPRLDPHIFYVAYGNSISVSLLLIMAALLFFPDLLSDILLISELSYAKSTLKDVDTQSKLQQLEQLMLVEKQYQNETLSLADVAETLLISAHQLSELINTHFDHGFPRYIREQRVNEAKRLLIAEPNSSVLAISMETGFKSQSNFYTAFKEITALSPGQFRKQNS